MDYRSQAAQEVHATVVGHTMPHTVNEFSARDVALIAKVMLMFLTLYALRLLCLMILLCRIRLVCRDKALPRCLSLSY